MRVGPNTRITLSDELKGPRDRVLIRRQSETIPFSDLDPPLQALLQGQEEGASNWEHPDILPGPEELEKELREDNALVRVTVPRSELPEGKLEIGGISVIIAVGSPHRDESFQVGPDDQAHEARPAMVALCLHHRRGLGLGDEPEALGQLEHALLAEGDIPRSRLDGRLRCQHGRLDPCLGAGGGIGSEGERHAGQAQRQRSEGTTEGGGHLRNAR